MTNLAKRSLIYGVLLGLFVVATASFLRERGQPETVRTGVALVGGPFTLTDSTGSRISEQDFAGRFMLVYFGYTFCPDVCPLDMQKITMVLDALEADGIDLSSLQPIFISIDPARDTPEIVGVFLENFHPSFIGLTGTDEEIAAVAGAYKVGYGKEPGPSGEENPDGVSGSDDDYLMFHSSVIYLMGRDGKFITHFSSTETPTSIAKALAGFIDG